MRIQAQTLFVRSRNRPVPRIGCARTPHPRTVPFESTVSSKWTCLWPKQHLSGLVINFTLLTLGTVSVCVWGAAQYHQWAHEPSPRCTVPGPGTVTDTPSHTHNVSSVKLITSPGGCCFGHNQVHFEDTMDSKGTFLGWDLAGWHVMWFVTLCLLRPFRLQRITSLEQLLGWYHLWSLNKDANI